MVGDFDRMEILEALGDFAERSRQCLVTNH